MSKCTLRCIYQSLMLPYLTYGLTAWGQAAKAHLNKLLLLQKRALRLMYFLNPRTHVIPHITHPPALLSYTLCMMSQITLLQKISLKNLSRPA